MISCQRLSLPTNQLTRALAAISLLHAQSVISNLSCLYSFLELHSLLYSLSNPRYLTEAAKRLTRVYHMYTNSSTFVYYQADKPLRAGATPQPPERDMDAAHFFSHLSGKKQSPRLYYSRSLPEGDLAPLTDDIDTSWMPTMPPLPSLTRPQFNGAALTQVRLQTWIHI